MYARRRGVGDVLNPTKGTALDCGLFNFGVFRQECWCLSFPSLCSQADYVASRQLADPSLIVAPSMPPAVGAPAGALLTTPPADAGQAQATIESLLSDQWEEWQAQNRATVAETAANTGRVEGEYQEVTGFPWYWWALGGLGVFAIATMGGGSPRRYGR